MPSSPTTGATRHSYGLAPASPSVELPPSPRAHSGEPLLPDVPLMSPPPRHVAQAAVPNPPHRRQTLESGRPPPSCSWHHGHSPAPQWAASPGRRPVVAVGRGLFSRAARVLYNRAAVVRVDTVQAGREQKSAHWPLFYFSIF
jgi:hypothetical protein